MAAGTGGGKAEAAPEPAKSAAMSKVSPAEGPLAAALGEETLQALRRLLSEVKIVGVITYAIGLTRDFVNPARFAANPKDFVKRLLGLVWPSFDPDAPPARAEGRVQLGTLLGISLFRTLLMNRMADLARRFNHFVQSRGAGGRAGSGGLQRLLAESAFAIAAGAALTALRNHATTSLALVFRERLTRAVHERYFQQASYYHIGNLPGRKGIPDADQRVSTEIASVATRLTNLVSLLLKAVPPLLWFTFRLWRARGWRVAVVPHLYLLLAYEGAQRLFPKNIGELYRDKAIAESGFNRGVSRLMSHGEAVVSLGGASREKSILDGLFDRVNTATLALHRGTSFFGLVFKIAYSYGCRTWLTCFVMLPPVSPVKAAAIPAFYASTRFALQVMLEMLVANGNLLTLHATATHMTGSAKRICTLLDTLDGLIAKQAVLSTGTMRAGDEISFEGVEIRTPSQHMLVKDLHFRLCRGESLLLTGHNGAGKSSIFRVLGGLWPTLTGTITKPGLHAAEPHRVIFYLPQKPYSRLGSLRDNVVYPSEGGAAGAALLSDEALVKLLRLVDLEHLLAQDAAADGALTNWESKLSLGEQQRLGMARLFFHRPTFAILDECTSSVSQEMELLLYRECRRLNITYITICHRPSLRIWHTHGLTLLGDGEGGYSFGPIEHTPAERQAIEAQAARSSAIDGEAEASAASTQCYAAALEARSRPYATAATAATTPANSTPTATSAVGAATTGLTPKRSGMEAIGRLLAICLPGTERQLGAFAVGILLRTVVHEMYAFAVGKLFGAAVNADWSLFMRFCLFNFVTDQSTAVIEEGVTYLQHLVGAAWHRQLALHCSARLLSHRHFYTLRNRDARVHDADQRISEEVKVATDAFADLFGRAIMPSIDMVWFTASLYRLMGVRGLAYLGSYALASAAVVKFFQPDNEQLDRREKELESGFKFVHNRLRNHAESIAFYHADGAEHAIAGRAFGDLATQARENRAAAARYTFTDLLVNKDFNDPSDMLSTPDVVTYLLELEYVRAAAANSAVAAAAAGGAGAGAAATAGVAQVGALASNGFYISAAARKAFSAFGKLSNIYGDVTKLFGSAARVVELLDVMDALEKADAAGVGAPSTCDENAIEMAGVDIVTPANVCLAKDLTLRVPAGESLMVTGRNSTGKTSFFRCLAGLWPARRGRVALPPGGLQLVPQKCYSVTGSLGDQVTYPDHLSPEERSTEAEERMMDALTRVGVAYLVEREGGWDVRKRWEDTLSLGEQQRIALARVLFHRPAFAVLDECTDAVSVDVERALYTALFEAGVTCITISKRLALEEFHTMNLQLGEPTDSGWSLYKLH